MQHKATIFYEWEQGKSAYSFPFSYLSKQFVKVRVDHANTSTLLEYNRDYTIEGQTLTLTPIQPFVSGATLCIYRQTPTGSLVDFSDGSLLLASEMDRLSTQLLHVEEENSDLIASTGMFADDDNSWQGQGRRIKNLSDPVDAHDAVTLSHLDKVGVARREEIEAIAARAEHTTTHVEECVATAATHQLNAEQALSGAISAREEAERHADAAKNSASEARESARLATTTLASVNTTKDNIITHENNVLRAEQTVKAMEDRTSQSVQWITGKTTEINGYARRTSEAAEAAAKSATEAAAIAGFSGVIDTAQIRNHAVTGEKIAPNSINYNHFDTNVYDIFYRLSGRFQPDLFTSILNPATSTIQQRLGNLVLYKDVNCKLNTLEGNDGLFLKLVNVVGSGSFVPFCIPTWYFRYPYDNYNGRSTVTQDFAFSVGPGATVTIAVTTFPNRTYVADDTRDKIVSLHMSNITYLIADVLLYKVIY